MKIRNALLDDIPSMRVIFTEAKQKMDASGNSTQWKPGHPTDEKLREDISRSFSYVVEEEGKVIATFALAICDDPTYKIIEQGEWKSAMTGKTYSAGKWLDDTLPYGTIHRVASLHGYHGVMNMVMDFCFSKIDNIRIDTHRNNKPMLHVIEKHGFTYCGIIHVADGTERFAFQKLIQ